MSKYNSSEYPVVVYKQDPLIVRVNALSLVVGSTSFYAKIKIGTMYNGFYVYSSALGEPIAKISSSATNRSETALKSMISEEAAVWMDSLQNSFVESTGQKNLVELLETVIENAETGAEIRIDATDTDVAEALNNLNSKFIYGDVESGTTVAEYSKQLNEKFINTNDSNKTIVDYMKSLDDKLTYNSKSIAEYLSSIDENIKTIAKALSEVGSDKENFAKVIAKAVQEGLSSMVTQMNAMNVSITSVKDTIGTKDDENTTTLFGTVNTAKSTTDNINTNVGSTSDSGTSTLCGIANTIKGNVDTVEDSVSIIKTTTSDMSTTMGKVSDSSSAQTMCGILNNIKATTSGGSSASDVSAIKAVVDEINRNTNSSSNLYTKVSDIKTAVGSTSQTSSNTICGNTNYIRTALTADDSGALVYNNHYWSIKTELTHDNMIVDDSGTKKVKAKVD